MAGSAIMSLFGALTYSRVLKRMGPARALPAAYILHGMAFLAEWWFASRSPHLVSVVLYLHMGALGGVVISAFWSLINEQFDPHRAKKYVSRIAASAALGGVIGGVLAERVIATLGLLAVLPILTGVTVAGAVLSSRIASSAANKPSEEEVDGSAIALGSTTYLRDLGAMVLVTATTSGLVDYVLKAEASERFSGSEALGSFFALFHAALSVLVFIVQGSLSSRSLSKLGIAGTVALLPGHLHPQQWATSTKLLNV
jgi:ATP/ADP translocase